MSDLPLFVTIFAVICCNFIPLFVTFFCHYSLQFLLYHFTIYSIFCGKARCDVAASTTYVFPPNGRDLWVFTYDAQWQHWSVAAGSDIHEISSRLLIPIKRDHKLSRSKFAKAWIQANHLSNVIIYRQGISLSLLLQCLLKLIFLEMTTSEENLFGGQIMRNYLLPMAAPPKVSKVKWYNTKPPYEGRRRKTRRNGWVADVSLQCIVVRQCGSHCGSMRGKLD